MDRGMKNGSTGVSMSSSLWLVFSRASSVSCLWSPPLSFCWACIISGQGVAWALHLYPYVPQHHSRRRQLLFSAACICLGIVWVPLSLTSWSTQWGPLIASILPSLILAFASSRCRG